MTKSNEEKKIVDFKIESLESQAQGVSKVTDKITFIQKTLPGDEGKAQVFKESKSIQFAKPVEFSKKSDEHIASLCEHFDECGGCHYLHCSYERELEFKTDAMKDIFLRQHRFSSIPDIELITAPKRSGYRNRIQVHYNKGRDLFGFIKSDNSGITNISNCQMGQENIQEKLSELVRDKNWKNLVSKERNKGHIEIYDKDGQTQVSVNKKYAHGGFSQVYQHMNLKMLEKINLRLISLPIDNNPVIDFFGGSGNLSKSINQKVFVIDSTPEKFIDLKSEFQEYVRLDLYDDNHLSSLSKVYDEEISTLLIDPPRSGYKDLDKLVSKYKPKNIIYVSCNPQTLARDISKISDDYEIEKLFLMDFFPSTRHFESMAFIRIK